MAYKKTLIRQYFRDLLIAGVTSVSGRVYSGRINPKADEEYPYLTVYTKDEDIVDQFTSHTSRELDLYVGIVVKNNNIADGDFDEKIEDVMFEVESIMGKVLTVQAKPTNDFFALLNDYVLESSTTESNNESSSDIGGAMLKYRVSYDYELPIVPLVLADFDVQGSIDNLIITNPGVPGNV